MRKKRTPMDRFWDHVEVTDSCWLWRGAGVRGVRGYGLFSNGERLMPAHRWIYEQLVGPIPEGLSLDHLCRVRSCVRPEHLEPVTTRENVLRGVGISALNAKKTHCLRGHPYDGDNLYVDLRHGKRHCRSCRAQADRNAKAKRRVA